MHKMPFVLPRSGNFRKAIFIDKFRILCYIYMRTETQYKRYSAQKTLTEANMNRRDKTNYYLDIAETVCERGTCLRRNFGAIIVHNDEIVSTGYNGAPRGLKNCCDLGICTREKLNVPRGQRYELCRSVHAEANCIISAARTDMLGATLYLACHNAVTGELYGDVEPCTMCKRLIINAGIKEVIVRVDRDSYNVITVSDWIENDKSIDGSEGY